MSSLYLLLYDHYDDEISETPDTGAPEVEPLNAMDSEAHKIFDTQSAEINEQNAHELTGP